MNVADAWPIPQLIGFERIILDAGSTGKVTVSLDLTPTRYRDPATRTWQDRPGDWPVVAAQHSPSVIAETMPLRSSS